MNFCDLSEICNSCCCDSKPGLLSGLKEDSKEFIYKGKQEIEYSKGETVLKQHTRINHIVCLKKGYLKVYTEGVSGKRLVRKILKPGEMIGGMGLFVDENHHFSCSALTNVQCCLLSADQFKALLYKDHDFCLSLIKRINKFSVTGVQKMVSLAQKTMHERVSDMLLYLSNEVYNSDDFETNLSRQDMADLCSLSKESVIRILRSFKDEGLINTNSSRIKIINKHKLLFISKTLG